MSSLNVLREFSKKQLRVAVHEMMTQRNQLGAVIKAIHDHMTEHGSLDLVDYCRITGITEEDWAVVVPPKEEAQ